MNKAKYSLTYTSWNEAEIEAIKEVTASGMFSMGKQVFEFEKQYASYVGSRFAVMVNSGSSANLLIIAALFFRKNNPLKRGDEVIVPAVSWSTTYAPLQQYGLRMKIVDVDVDTFNFDLKALKEAVTDKTKLIFTVDLLGNSNDYSEIRKIIGDRKIDIIEDSCESMGAEYQNKKVGSLGLMGSFSMFYSHHISTMEGGMVITDDEELHHIMLALRAHGWTRNLPKENKLCTKSENVFHEHFRFILPGYNFRPLEMSGAIGIKQLEKLPKIVEVRRKNAELFVQKFKDHPSFSIQKEIGKSSWFGFGLIIKDPTKLSRDEVIKKLTDSGIETRPIVAGNIGKSEMLKYFDYEIFGSLKNADKLDQHGFFVGNNHNSLTKEIELLESVLSDV